MISRYEIFVYADVADLPRSPVYRTNRNANLATSFDDLYRRD